MNNKDVFLKNNKENYVKNLSAQNEAKRLEEKVKSYNKNLNNNRNSTLNNSPSNSSSAEQKLNMPRKRPNTSNSKATNELASKGVQSLGVPKPLADKAVNSELGQKVISNAKKKNFALNALDKLMGGGQKQVEEQTSDGGGSSFKMTYQVVKYLSIALLGSLIPFMILAMIIPSSMIFLNSIKLGHADSISEEGAEKKINKKSNDVNAVDEDKSGEEAINYNIDNTNLYAYVDIYETNSNRFKSLKLDSTKTTKYLKRKYNEADLDALEDFYPTISEYGKDYDKNMVYDFFFKMYNLYTTYRDDYGVYLDLPLLMSTLNMQSDDMNVIFSSNLTKEDRAKTARKKPIAEFAYDYDWSNYKLSSTKSQHDMEILAQHMVSKQVNEYCQNESGVRTQEHVLKDSEIGIQSITCAEGETYQTEDLGYLLDYNKYDEFLKQFLERKYFLDEDTSIEEDNPPINNSGTAAVGSFRSWTQCKQSWSNKKIGNPGGTMCSIGCLVTSLSIQIARSGTAITTDSLDPGIAAKKFSFTSGGGLYWGSVKNLAPFFIKQTEFSTVGMSKSSLASKILSYDSNKYYFILHVGKKGRKSAHHYVALDYVNSSTGDIYIMDPAGTNMTSLYDYYKVYSVVVYEKKD